MDLKLGLDIQNKALLAIDGTPLTLPALVQGDDISITLQGMERLASGDYLKVPIDFSRIKIGIGLLDAPPVDGTYVLSVDGVQTPALPYNASKEFIAAELSKLTSVSSRGGIRVLPNGAANVHVLAWTNPAITTPISVVEKKLFPHCFSRVITWSQEVGTLFIIKLFQAPLAFTDAFALPTAPPVTVVAVRPGTGTRNEIQRINIPRDAQGEFSLAWNGLTTVIIPVAEASPTSIAAALNNLYSDGITRFKVTQPGTTYYYVEFVGPLAHAPQSLLSATMESQQQQTTPVGSFDLKGAGLEYALAGKASITLRLEIEITTASGAIGTPIQADVTVLNDMLDTTMGLVPDPQWIEEQRSKPVVVEYNWEAPPTFLGTIGYGENAGDAVGQVWQFIHNMGTRDVHITVRDNVTGLRVPDDEYEAAILDANTVQLTFPTIPEVDRYAVLITAANVGEHFASHTHPISDIIGLQDILDALTAIGNPLDLWPSIPVEKLPLIPFEKLTGTIPDEMLPSDIPRLDDKGTIPLTNIPSSIPRINEDGSLVVSLDGKSWTALLASDGKLAPGIFGDLSKVPAFVVAIKNVLAGLGADLPTAGITIPLQTTSELIAYQGTAKASSTGYDPATLPHRPPALLTDGTYNRELWRVAINEQMFAVGRTLSIDWGVSLQMLRATCHAQYTLVVELGTYGSNLVTVDWRTSAPVFSLPVSMTAELTTHSFGLKLQRTADQITLLQYLYGISSPNTGGPATANFALRCRLINLDPEDISDPRGWVSYAVVPSTYSTSAKIAQAVIS